MGEGATCCHPPSEREIKVPPPAGGLVLAFRPACDSCIAGIEPRDSINLAISWSFATCSSFQMPKHAGVIRPSGVIAVASAVTTAAPPTAREPRCTRCQLLAKPSSDEYWHIGETMMRWGSVTL